MKENIRRKSTGKAKERVDMVVEIAGSVKIERREGSGGSEVGYGWRSEAFINGKNKKRNREEEVMERLNLLWVYSETHLFI